MALKFRFDFKNRTLPPRDPFTHFPDIPIQSIVSLLPSRIVSLAIGGGALVVGCLAVFFGGATRHLWQPATVVVVLMLILLSILLAQSWALAAALVRRSNLALKALEDTNVRLKLAQSAADIAMVDWDIANDHAVWSSNFVNVFGITETTPATKTPYALFIDLVHPEDRFRIDAMHHRILKFGGEFSEEFRIKTAKDAIRWIAIRGEVFCDEKGVARRFIGTNFDITARRQNEDRLKDSLAIIELANETGEIGVWNIDIKSKLSSWDERARKIFGIISQDDRFSFATFKRAIHADDLAKVRSVLRNALKTGEKFLLEARIHRPNQTIGWVRIRGIAELDPLKRRALKITGIVFDVTDRRTEESRHRFLLRELTHRSKNLLAVIQAMARQSGGTSTTLLEFQVQFSARLHGLSTSHDLLLNEDWRGAFIGDIVRAQVEHFTDVIDVRIKLNGPPLLLKPEAAQNIGLALHELSTNAVKYGALANATGVVEIFWEVTSSSHAASSLRLTWSESGGPLVLPPSQRGFGSVVTQRIVARALDGQVKVTYEPTGVVWTLEIPASYIIPNEQRLVMVDRA